MGGLARGQAFPEFYAAGHVGSRQPITWSAPAPVAYRGKAQLQRDIDNLKAAVGGAKPEEAFMPAISPSSAADWQRNAYYKTDEEYVFAVAEAMREEYEAIVDAGFLLQIDDPRLVTYWVKKPDLDRGANPQVGGGCASRRSITRCAISRRTRSGTTPATASIWGRASTTSSSRTSSTSF